MKKVTVVIPNWNGMRFLKTCLDSLEVQDTDDFDVLIIDNASTDESVSFIHENYPEYRVDVMKENLGFAGGVNEGIRRSLTPYVLLLNNDIECDPAFVRRMTETMDKDDQIFSISSRMIQFHHREKLDDAGDLYTIVGWAAQRGVGQPVTDRRYLKSSEIFSTCAGAALYRKRVFDEIGMFDPMHFAYLEDVDLSYRALIYGYKNVYEPKAVVYHVGSGTSGSRYNEFKVKLSARNNLYVVYKNMPAFQRGLNALPLYVGRKFKERFFNKMDLGDAYRAGLKEGRSNLKSLNKVPFRMKHFWNYVRIEGLLISNMFVYADEYLRRARIKRQKQRSKFDQE